MDDRRSGSDQLAAALKATASDIQLLARLHDREIDAGLWTELSQCDARDWFALALDAPEAAAGLELMGGYVKSRDGDAACMDELAAEFADIYLTFGRRVAPNESFWLTEDHIERQEPMFEVRNWYAHYGLAAQNWRVRADDHLVTELQFVAWLLESGHEAALLDAGRFMDRHLLCWSPDFFGGVARLSAQPFYAGLALYSEAHLRRSRALIAEATGEPPTVPAPRIEPRVEHRAFVPGLQPSW